MTSAKSAGGAAPDRAARGGPRAPALLIVLLLATAACARPAAPDRQLVEFRGPTMGTTFSVKVAAGPGGLTDPEGLERAIAAELGRIDALMSTWRADSELSRFNRWASLEPFAVSPETFEVFAWALDLADLTGGALDVTVGPLVEAWGFGPGGPRGRAPAGEEIARLLEARGAHLIELDRAAGTVRKRHPAVACDFSAIAPGYAADRIAARLVERELEDFLVDVGGELRVRGQSEAGRPWQIGIERPEERGRAVARVIELTAGAVSTSGDYRNYHEVDGVRVAHILDPRTGRPIRHRLASVTVVDELAVRADGLSTALMVLGPDEGADLAARLGLAALFIVRRDGGGFDVRATPRFEALAGREIDAAAPGGTRGGER